jgi:hypothetical protein
MMNLPKLFFGRRPILFLAGVLLNVLCISTTLSAHAISHINGVDLREAQGTLNLYIHTDSPLRHEAKQQGKAIVIDLYETTLTSNAFAIQYEKAPSVESVRVKHLENGHLQLMIEGRGLTLPIIGFRELNKPSTTHTFKQATLVKQHSTLLRPVSKPLQSSKTLAGDVFLAIESGEIKKIPTPIKAPPASTATAKSQAIKSQPATDDLSVELNPNTNSPNSPRLSPLLENDPSLAHMSIAIESDGLDELDDEENETLEETSIRQTLQTLFVLLVQWAKAHSNLLLGFLFASTIGFFFLTKLKKSPALEAYPLDSNKRFILPETSMPLGLTPSEAIRDSYATRLKPPPKPTHQNTLQRVREKMKHTGFVSAPEAPQQQEVITEDGVNVRVKEAIARKQAQRYGKMAQAPTPLSSKNLTTPLENPAATGHAFLHAMAQHMNTEGKENIAKAIQQSKPQY